MASSLLSDDEDNATRNTQQQQQLQQPNNNHNNNSCLNAQNNKNLNESLLTSTSSKMQDNEAKLKKQSLEQRKLELEKLLNEKSWLLQQLQKQESHILNGNFEFMNFNDFISNLAVQYKQEQTATNSNTHSAAGDSVSTLSGGVSHHLTTGEESILRRKPLTAKENYQNLNNNNVLHRRQSEISNRSSEYDNYPQNDNISTHSEGGRANVIHGAAQASQQYAAKAALKKRSATVAGTTAQSSSNLQMIRQQHLEQQQQQLLYKHHQQQQQQQQHQHQQYHHPQQHLFKPHFEHHQVLMPHLQYATQKFYYTTLQPQPSNTTQQQHQQQQNQQQVQYGRYIQSKQIAQQQTQHHNQNMGTHQQHQILLTPPSTSGLTVDNISLYSLNSNNVATLHRPAQQQQPIIVQCDKYYLSPTSHHISHSDGCGFIKSSQNIKEYVSPHSSPQSFGMRDKTRIQASQANLSQRGATPALDIISLAPSYVSMETIDYSTSPVASNMRWRSQTNLPPLQLAGVTGEIKSQSNDMLNNNQYYNTALNPPPPPPTILVTQNQNIVPPPNVTQVKPFKPLDDISINFYPTETQKKLKPKQWLESSLDGPVIRQTPVHDEPCSSTSFSSNNNNNNQTRTKLSSQSLSTTRHYSMSAAQSKSNHNQNPSTNPNNSKLSQSTSYLNQMDFINANPLSTPTPSISQAYNLELSPQTSAAYKYLTAQQKASARPATGVLYVNTSNSNLTHSATTPPLAAALSPDIRIESPVNMTIVQPATFQPYKEVTKPFEMSDFYKYSTKFRQKENNNNNNSAEN